MGVAFAVFGVGGLVGTSFPLPPNRHLRASYRRLRSIYAGPPINGALLTGHFVWWRPALFSGVRVGSWECHSH